MNKAYPRLPGTKTGVESLAVLAIALLAAAAVWAHVVLLNVPADVGSPLMVLDRVFDIGIVLLLSLGALGLGRAVLRACGFSLNNLVADTVLAWGLGAGIASHGLLVLGILHLLYVPVVLGVSGVVLLLTAPLWLDSLTQWQAMLRHHRPFSPVEKVFFVAAALLVLPVFFSALLPPTEGDALSYQLAGPAQFLNLNAIVPLYENTGANYPLGAGLLFLPGLAVSSAIAAQLTHFVYGLALMGALYAFCAENFSRPVGLVAAAIFWTSPVIGLEAGAPLVDLGWVFYEFVAVWMFWRWHQTRSSAFLVAAGIGLGLAVSSKYLAMVGWGTLAIFLVVDAFHESGYDVRATFKALLLLNMAAFVTALPWLAKNAFLLGNPVYPFFWGAYGLDGQLHKPGGAVGGLGDWVGAGMGNDWKALLTFPINVYLQWERFDSVKNRGGPSFFFWILPFYLLVQKRPVINFLLLLVLVRFAVWWNLTQFVRYGLILFPLLSVICAYVVVALGEQVRGRWTRPFLRIGVGLALVIGILLEWGFFFLLHEGAPLFLAGIESRTTYLNANLHDAPVTQFMNQSLPLDARIFAIGDTRVFYAKRYVIGDVSHTNWADLVALGKTVEGVHARLLGLGITHVWMSEDEIIYSKNFWNIETPGENKQVSFDEFKARYLHELYHDERGHTVFEISP